MCVKRWSLLLILPVLLLLMGARQAPLTDPDPVAIPAGLSADVVQREIKRALVGRNWTITAEQPGRIDATLNLRAHVARIRLTHGDGQLRVAYVSSENLAYEDTKGQRYIHKNYLSWVNNVLTDAARNLQMAALE